MSEMHQHRAFPFDPLMPELAAAADPATMCRLLAQHLWADGPQDATVEDCRITRIRYRPQTRCFLQYSVTLRDTRTAALSRHWVTGSLYAEPRRAARLARKVSDAVFIPELRMLVSVFPADRKLPQSSRIMAGGDPELEAAVLRTFGDDAWKIDRWSVEPVRYREHLSLVIRYTVHARNTRSGEIADRVFYVKAYPEPELADRAFEHLRELAAHTASAPFGVRIDAPVACFDHLRAVLLQATEGQPLSEIIACDDDRVAVSAVRAAARGLARFNLSDAPMRRQYTSAEYVRSLERPIAILEWARPELGADLRAVLAMVARTARSLDLRPTHRDMKPEHVLLGGGSTAFIDLDSCAAADPVLDVALMLARFAGARGDSAVSTRRMETLATAFSEDYFTSVPQSWRARLPTYYAGSLIEVAAGMFHRQEAQWKPRVRELVRAAVQAADGADRPH